MSKTEYIESLVEELKLNGFDVVICTEGVSCNSIFGKWIYKPAFSDLYMRDFYRFIQVYGYRLTKYGLTSRHEYESKELVIK
jgi:hypothetical protein